MSDFSSPIDVFIFVNINAVSFLVNNVWTFVAIVTAAIGFWRFKVVTNAVNDVPEVCQTQETVSGSSIDENEANGKTFHKGSSDGSCGFMVSVSSPFYLPTMLDGEDPPMTPKEKFFAVIKGDNEVEVKEEDVENDWENEEEEEEEEEGSCGTRGGDDDVMLAKGWNNEEEVVEDQMAAPVTENFLRVTRMGDKGYQMGWYRCQDLRVLNGSVVKLWEDSRSPSTSPRRRCSSPVGTTAAAVRCAW